MGACLILVAGLVTYQNSFSVPFLFDDPIQILENSRIRELWPLGRLVSGTTRPVVELSLAINYALGGFEVWGYHLFNLIVHLLAGLTLFGILRRTLVSEGAALAASLLWMVHPLQTQSVTYVIQRAESMMALFYLVTLYGVIRGAHSPRRARGWYLLAFFSCVLGMGCKAVMMTAPLFVLLYDRIFLASSFREVLRRRGDLYLGFVGTWVLAGFLVTNVPPDFLYETSAGFSLKKVSPWEYARTQPGIILHYLKLIFWPRALVFDYAWPVAQGPWQIFGPLTLLGLLFLGILWTARRKAKIAFGGAAFFIFLFPSSSFIPVVDLAFEYRMYLPSTAVITLAVLAADQAIRRFFPRERTRSLVALFLLIPCLGLLGWMTMERNQVYQSGLSLWSDVVAKRPTNPRALNNLGIALAEAGRAQEAIRAYEEALRLHPENYEAQNNLANALSNQGKPEEALLHYQESVALKPTFAEAHANLADTLSQLGQHDEALRHARSAVELRPDLAEVQYILASVLYRKGDRREALDHFLKALSLKSDFAEAHVGTGLILEAEGQVDQAIAQYQEALRLRPDLSEAQESLRNALSKKSRETGKSG